MANYAGLLFPMVLLWAAWHYRDLPKPKPEPRPPLRDWVVALVGFLALLALAAYWQ
jgi:hypothetical protein